MLFSARQQSKKNITGTLRIQFDEDKEDGDDELTVEEEEDKMNWKLRMKRMKRMKVSDTNWKLWKKSKKTRF